MDKDDTYYRTRTTKDSVVTTSMSSEFISSSNMSMDSYTTTPMTTDAAGTTAMTLGSLSIDAMSIDSIVTTDSYFDLLDYSFDKITTYFDSMFELSSIYKDTVGLEVMTRD